MNHVEELIREARETQSPARRREMALEMAKLGMKAGDIGRAFGLSPSMGYYYLCTQPQNPREAPRQEVCGVDGCLRPHCSKGLCNMHWQRRRRGISQTECRAPGCETLTSWKWCERHRGSHKRFEKYGITDEEFVQMVNEQGGLCAICRENGATEIDHDHETGITREILCKPCNHGLGFFRDDTQRLANAIDYLRRNK